jgi:hypothetical protein
VTSFVVVVAALAFMSLLGRVIQTWLKHREMTRREREEKERIREAREQAREERLNERLDQQREGYYQVVRELREALAPASPEPEPEPHDPPKGFVKVDPTVKAGDIVTHTGEECYVAEVVHQINQGEYLTWAKLSPVPLPKTALDRLLDEDGIV